MNRRSLIKGIALLVAAPAIVRVSSIMPVKALPDVLLWPDDMLHAQGYLYSEEFTQELINLLRSQLLVLREMNGHFGIISPAATAILKGDDDDLRALES